MIRALAIALVASMLTPAQAAAELLRRDDARNGLLAFTRATHPKWIDYPHHEKVCHYLEMLERRAICDTCKEPITKFAQFAPPRSSKTDLSLRRLVPWAMARNPGWNTISAMANTKLATDTGGEVRDVVDCADFKSIFPEATLKPDAKSSQRWIMLNKGLVGTYFCGGVDSSFPGRGCNILGIDDPHKSAQEADSQTMRDQAAKAYFGDLSQRLEYPEIEMLTNTRRHIDDLAGRILTPTAQWTSTGDDQFFCCGNGWHVLRLRGIENEGTAYEVGLRTKRMAPDADPTEAMQKLRSWYKRQGEYRYWVSEFQQEPTVEEGTEVLREWFDRRWTEKPEDMAIYIAWDGAVTKKKDGSKPARTEIGVFGIPPMEPPEDGELPEDAPIHVLDWKGGAVTMNVWIEWLVDMIIKWNPRRVIGEKGVIKNASLPFLRKRMRQRKAYARLSWVSTFGGDKLARGQPFIGIASSGQFLLPNEKHNVGYEWVPEFINDVVAVPTGYYWDKFDTAAIMCQYSKTIQSTVRGPAPKPKRKPKPGEYRKTVTATKSSWRTG